MDSILACGIFRNAATEILEWLAFHRLVGVDRFVLYDAGTDQTAALIARSRFARYVTVIDWSQRGGRAEAYADFAARPMAGFTWVAIVDPGDFLLPCERDTLLAELPRYDGFSAVVLRRLHFVTANRPRRPGQLVTAACPERLPSDAAANEAVLTLIRVANLQGVHGAPAQFSIAGPVCNARGQALAAPIGLAQTCDDIVVRNRYHAGMEGPGATPDRRIARFIPRVRALLHVPPAEAPRPAPAAPPPPRPAAAPETLQLGIGIITYNRAGILAATLDRVRQHTRHQRTIVAVADDGSADDTLPMLRQRQVLTATGANSGIAWNKNRALFMLCGLLHCDVTILLEDDAYPTQDGWEQEWIRAALRWGHVNNAPPWLQADFVSGAGTAEDPIRSPRLSAQCSVYSRESILFGGYFDTRFRHYGHEHVEHSYRLLRMGYGGPVDDISAPRFRLIPGSLGYHMVASSFAVKTEEAEQNRALAQDLAGDASYRAPWRSREEAWQMREEMRRTFPHPVLP